MWDWDTFHRGQSLMAHSKFSAVAYHSSESQLVTVGSDRQVAYWEAFNGALIREVMDEGALNGLDTGADGQWFVTGGEERLVKVCSWQCAPSCVYR